LFEFQELIKIIPTLIRHARVSKLLPTFYTNLEVKENIEVTCIKDKEIDIILELVF
jgi:hypothetical protein